MKTKQQQQKQIETKSPLLNFKDRSITNRTFFLFFLFFSKTVQNLYVTITENMIK